MLQATKNMAINKIAQPVNPSKKPEASEASFADVLSGQNVRAQNVGAQNKAAKKTDTSDLGADATKNAKKGSAQANDKPDQTDAASGDASEKSRLQKLKDALGKEEPTEDEKEDSGALKGNAYIAQLLMMMPQIEEQAADNEAVAQPEQNEGQNLNVLEGLNVQMGQQQAEEIVAATIPSTGDAEEMARTPEIIIPLEGMEHEAEAAPAPRRTNPSPLENVQKQTDTRVNEEADVGTQLAKPIEENGAASGGGDQDFNSSQNQGPQMAVPTYAFNMAPLERFDIPAEPAAPPQLPQALAESAISQTIETIAMGVANGQQVISIQMKPEFLGRLEMQLLMGPEGLTAKIRTSDPAVQATIASQINQMQAELRDKGIQVTQVEVLLSTQQEFMDSQQGANQQFQQGKTRYARVGSVEAQITPIVTYGDELQIQNLNGSVDYTA